MIRGIVLGHRKGTVLAPFPGNIAGPDASMALGHGPQGCSRLGRTRGDVE